MLNLETENLAYILCVFSFHFALLFCCGLLKREFILGWEKKTWFFLQMV